MNIQGLTERVISRLSQPRIAFLWDESVPSSAKEYRKSGFTIVHYVKGEKADFNFKYPAGTPIYRLEDLNEPWEEYHYINALVSIKPRLYLFQDLLTGIPATPEGQITAGCLGNGIPVIIDFRCLESWSLWRGGMGLAFFQVIEKLKEMGISFMNWRDTSSQINRESANEKCVISGPGWYSWNEISELLGECSTLRITEGVRLTGMALEMLKKNNITLEVMKG